MTTITHFKKDDYIVITKHIGCEADESFPINTVFKQRNKLYYLEPYLDCMGSTTNGWSCIKADKSNAIDYDWRYATKEEAEMYEKLGKPFNISIMKENIKYTLEYCVTNPSTIVIETPTKELYLKVVEICNPHYELSKNNWEFYGRNTAVFVEESKCTYSPTSHYKEHYPKTTIITAEQFIKDNMEERKIIGYKLAKPEMQKAVEAICKCKLGTDEKGWNISPSVAHAFDKIKDAGVLDLWFEPVYEEKVKYIKLTGLNNCTNHPKWNQTNYDGPIGSVHKVIEFVKGWGWSTGKELYYNDIYICEDGYVFWDDVCQPITEEEFKKKQFKEGDWVVVISAENGAKGANGMVGQITNKDNKKGLCKKTINIEGRDKNYDDMSVWSVGYGAKLRKATKEEIEKATILRVDKYEIKFNGRHTTIDGHFFTKEFWQAALEITKHTKAAVLVGCGAKIKGSGNQWYLTQDLIERVLERLK